MLKFAALALILAAIIGWAAREQASVPAPGVVAPAPPPRMSREQFAQKVRDNAAMRAQLAAKYPDTWRDLSRQTRADLGGCIVVEAAPGILKATCR